MRIEQPLEEVYTIGKKLGEGSFGKVYRVEHIISGEKRVCKKISKASAGIGMPMDAILQEISNMAQLDHPNVVKVYEYFEDDDDITQIMEPCDGGELEDTIQNVFKKGYPPYSEAFICDVMKQTLRALAFMHAKGYVHKDLKPQNIMRTDKETSSIKVIDFGLAELFKMDQKYARQVGGTLLYMAPECFRNKLSFKGDIWSAGVILFNLITGAYPFMATWPPPPGKNEAWWNDEVAKAICTKPPGSNKALGRVSPDCIQLLMLMLEKDAAKRPDATQCLSHTWFRRFEDKPSTLSVGVLQCLEAYSREPELKKTIFLLMAHQCALPALFELRAIFTYFDVRNHGVLEFDDLLNILLRSGFSKQRANFLLEAMDRDGDGSITWTEFCAAALCVKLSSDQRLIDAAFATFCEAQEDTIYTDDFMRILAVGPSEARWLKELPHQFDEIKKKVTKPSGVMKLVSFCIPPRDLGVTREDFRGYMSKKIHVRHGDELYTVT